MFRTLSGSSSFPRPAARTPARATFVLVRVQEVLELGVEDLQVLLDQDLLALPGQLVLSGLVEVNLHAPLLLQQTGLGLAEASRRERWRPCPGHPHLRPPSRPTHLLHVLGHRVLLEELGALARVEALGVGQELALEVLLVDGQRGSLGEGVLLVQTQLN